MMKTIVGWEYHFQLKRAKKRELNENITLEVSIWSVANLISIFIVLPIILIVGAHVLMSLDSKLEINKWIGAFPVAILIMINLVLLQKYLKGLDFSNLISASFDANLRKKMIFLRASFFILFLCSWGYVIYILKHA